MLAALERFKFVELDMRGDDTAIVDLAEMRPMRLRGKPCDLARDRQPVQLEDSCGGAGELNVHLTLDRDMTSWNDDMLPGLLGDPASVCDRIARGEI